MRFLKLLFRYLMIGGVVFVSVGFIVINVLVYVQAVALADSFSDAKRLSRKPAHILDCMMEEVDYEETPLYGYQVRFKSDTEYVVEAICRNGLGPFEVKTGTLELGVKKLPGFSGVMFPLVLEEKVDGVVVLNLWFAKWSVAVGELANMEIKYVSDEKEISPGKNAAISSCEGWGYRCCNSLTEVGEGDAVWDNIMDCSGGCFSSCRSRPSILIFTSDPEFDSQKNRVVRISKSDPLVVFSYSVQDIDSESMQVMIDFGDGQTAESSNTTDQFSHSYNCRQSLCTYTATLSAVDDGDLENTRTRIDTITVQVR